MCAKFDPIQMLICSLYQPFVVPVTLTGLWLWYQLCIQTGKQIDQIVTCDPWGGLGTWPLCSISISWRGLRLTDQRWRSNWVAEISWFTGDNKLSIGKRAHVRTSFTIYTRYWPVAYDPQAARYAWYWVASGEARHLFAWLLLTGQ